MRRKLTTLRAKQGHSQNGAPRTVVDLATYREHHNNRNVHTNTSGADSPHYDPQYSGWSNPSRPRDHAAFLRPITPIIDLG